MATHVNPTFVGDDGKNLNGHTKTQPNHPPDPSKSTPNGAAAKPGVERDLWGNDIEFLFSCIAMSVGLGNVWRFPFTALENGGGAFLIPYLIVLFLVGKPIYYLEMIVGQFSSRGSVKAFELCPAMKGVGLGQLFMVFLLGTYYESVVALICYYFASSFRFPLPWAHCRPEWEARCFDSSSGGEYNSSASISNLEYLKFVEKTSNDTIMTSSELFFIKEVLKEKDSIVDGIGYPNWPLVLGLFVSWIMIYLLIIRGVKSSGKASYFLAIFPYIVMIILLIRAVTLEGSADGIIYFIKPQWEKILSPKVWYAAVTQVFYSLSVCFGNIIMYSSYNKFNHNVYRDATIVTLLDTFTSLLAGFTIFGILGHLAHEIGTTDVGTVVKGGTGLAFISYPDAIAKFKAMPQIFSVLFFVMLFVLGIGSNIAMTSCTMTAIRDSFPKIPQSYCALGISVISFLLGLLYVTPGGQFILTLVDYFGASMIALTLGIIELYVFAWVYGVDRLCRDAQFMIGKSPSWYWRICWGVITPLIMTAIWIYTFVAYEPLTYKDVKFPSWGYAIGWTITAFGVAQVPIWACVAIVKQPGDTLMEKVRGAFRPKANWGPNDLVLREQYHKEMAIYKDSTRNLGFFGSIRQNLFG
ncbi:sodium-dependent nutrient amino acid transporter 1 isoform X1 [Episyrphus balteatus]|uniref:sodium-dependent nutrient amino acid transporter 1 isoform X1 n=1 Tax=Episyrphus balteatus TaxID=286459 RepID=UPI0024857B4D|nr:sodium-dependent nutrient amino acid transporter 1 isoform X1 [Episyrphus balteatus]